MHRNNLCHFLYKIFCVNSCTETTFVIFVCAKLQTHNQCGGTGYNMCDYSIGLDNNFEFCTVYRQSLQILAHIYVSFVYKNVIKINTFFLETNPQTYTRLQARSDVSHQTIVSTTTRVYSSGRVRITLLTTRRCCCAAVSCATPNGVMVSSSSPARTLS